MTVLTGTDDRDFPAEILIIMFHEWLEQWLFSSLSILSNVTVIVSHDGSSEAETSKLW